MPETNRHNQARGVHGVLLIAEIHRHLIGKMSRLPEKIRDSLGMYSEEVSRRYGRGYMTARSTAAEFNHGLEPDPEGIKKGDCQAIIFYRSGKILPLNFYDRGVVLNSDGLQLGVGVNPHGYYFWVLSQG
jgi:hypothetical protein